MTKVVVTGTEAEAVELDLMAEVVDVVVEGVVVTSTYDAKFAERDDGLLLLTKPLI